MTVDATLSVEAALARHDVRLGGTWTPAQRVKNGLIAWSLFRAISLADRLPPRVLLAFGRAAGRAAYRVRELRRVAEDNVTRYVGADRANTIARAAFERAGENLARCLLLRRPETRALDWVDVPDADLDTFRRALAERRGVVFVSAHLGPFELVPAAVAELGIAPTIVVRESYDPRLDTLVDAHRIRRGIDVIHRGKPTAPSRIVRALRAGRPVGFLPDLGARVPSLRVPFLGDTTALPVGPQRLARRLGCPLVVGTLARRGHADRFSLSIRRLETDGDESELTRRVAGALGDAIRSQPEDWLWMARGFG